MKKDIIRVLITIALALLVSYIVSAQTTAVTFHCKPGYLKSEKSDYYSVIKMQCPDNKDLKTPCYFEDLELKTNQDYLYLSQDTTDYAEINVTKNGTVILLISNFNSDFQIIRKY